MSYGIYSPTKSVFCDFQHIARQACISNETIPL
ncbi:hypothetical protein FBY13_101290 [Pantoea sp. SJZ147]|nr:hypothetical protein FBY13_101290 [Pantoea sp. SJZ147]